MYKLKINYCQFRNFGAVTNPPFRISTIQFLELMKGSIPATFYILYCIPRRDGTVNCNTFSHSLFEKGGHIKPQLVGSNKMS